MTGTHHQYGTQGDNMELRPHQAQAVEEIEASVAFGSQKLIADLPTSFGKSFVLSTLAEQLAGRIVIIVTFTALIEQIAAHLDEVGVKYSILKAGMEDRFDPTQRIQLVMAQTLHARHDKLNMKADFLLKDEVHVEWLGQKRMDSIYTNLGEPTVIGVSGTPFDSRGYLLKGSDDLIRTKTVKQLTEEGFLTPVRYYVPQWAENVDYDDLTIKGNDYSEADIDDIVLQKEYMEPALSSMLAMDIVNRKSIVFCNSIEHCELVAANLRAKGVKAHAFHSKVDKRLSERILESYRTNKVVCDVNLLGEEADKTECTTLCAVNKVSIGFDVPDIELGVMLRKMGVRSLFYQQIGRGIRTYDGKENFDLLDLANNTATFGFHDEVYNPPEHGNREELKRENERLEARTIKLIVNDEPTIVERSLVLEKLRELEAKSHRIPELSFKDLAAIYETSQSTRQIIEIGYEINRRKTGAGYQDTQVDWANELWPAFVEDHIEFRSRILRALRTRLKNIVSSSKKVASIHYFPDWLGDQSPYKGQEEPASTYSVPDFDIAEEDIPF